MELSVVDILPLYVVVVGMTAIERNQRRGPLILIQSLFLSVLTNFN